MSRKARKPGGASDGRRWSGRAMRARKALVLENTLFALASPNRIVLSLKRLAVRSGWRKPEPSAMSKFTFFVNRARKTLSARGKRILERAKNELRWRFGRT